MSFKDYKARVKQMMISLREKNSLQNAKTVSISYIEILDI